MRHKGEGFSWLLRSSCGITMGGSLEHISRDPCFFGKSVIFMSWLPDPGTIRLFMFELVRPKQPLYTLMPPILILAMMNPEMQNLLSLLKRGSSGVCGLWPVAEPSQNKRRRARSLIGR